MENLEVKIKKMNITSILFSIIFILIGSFLLARPEDAIHLVSYALGIILIAWGVISVVSFFTDKESQNYLEFGFILGVFVLIFGIIILVKPDTIASIIPLLLGIWMLINGVTKLSYSLTLNNNKSALSSIIISLIIVLLGILLIINPFQGAQKLVQILGISILVYSLLDLIECFSIKRVIKKSKKLENKNVIDAEYTEL
ncbi:MAG: DUF308 domain-containing protein [Bacilli bacterium]|nr:DUF308 domain-containing protein [Bacilli bacterium]